MGQAVPWLEGQSPSNGMDGGDALERRIKSLAAADRTRLAALATLSDRQRTLAALVTDEPALNIREIAERLGVQRTAAKHHVRFLVARGHLVTVRQGRHLLHFPAWMPDAERRSLAALRIGSVRSVVAAVFAAPGISAGHLPAQVGLKPRTVRATLRFLRHAGLVELERETGTRLPKVHLRPETRVTWARWFDPTRDRIGPLPLEEKPTRMAMIGASVLSWLGAANA